MLHAARSELCSLGSLGSLVGIRSFLAVVRSGSCGHSVLLVGGASGEEPMEWSAERAEKPGARPSAVLVH